MRILLVYCHPVPESFCASIRDTALRALEKNGHQVDLLDLYAEGFDPVMPADERRSVDDAIKHPAWARLVTRASENFIFIGPELKYWLDGEWKPVQRTEAERRQMQKELLEQAESYLGRFSK